MFFAHSLPEQPITRWESLSTHLKQVAARAGGFGDPFGFGAVASTSGLLHDIGKCSVAFQSYIRKSREPGSPKGPDHSSAGAYEARTLYPGALGRMLAYVVAGHHAGLSDAATLDRRTREKPENAYPDWTTQTGELPSAAAMRPTWTQKPNHAGFSAAFTIRMLFSCLVDADWLETERFTSASGGQPIERGGFAPLPLLRDRLRATMAAKMATTEASAVNMLRCEVLDCVVGKAVLEPGLFTLTVPTGGGKTLASMAFALEHATKHGLRRVVYVAPFTSIIEQTAAVFRDAMGTNLDVLEHHSTFDWARAETVANADDEGPDGVRKLRRAAENWDAPIVVTTAVQFFESLFANRRGRCRKLHNLAGAVIILDEAQTLPVALLHPSLAALQELASNFGASVVICTATQPAWRQHDGAILDDHGRLAGLPICPSRELAPDPAGLFNRLRRTHAEVLPGLTDDTVVVDRFEQAPEMLCIVNSRRHARELYDRLQEMPGAVHLTTLMCARHRQAVLAQVRLDLKANRPVRLIATSLIEAGVDVSFPEVWRAAAGLDAINQAAGRCNREGLLAEGRVVVFEPADAKPPADMAAFWQAAQPALRAGHDPLSLEAVQAYFHELYFVRGAAGLDAARLDGEPWPILRHLADASRDWAFDFAKIADAYRLISEATRPVIVPFDTEAEAALAAVANIDRPGADVLRRLQPYTVALPQRAWSDWLAAGVLRPVNPLMGEALLRFEDLAHYRPDTGVDLRDPLHRSAEANIF